MKALWFLIPLYLLPLVVNSDTILTVLIFTFLLSILWSASTSCSAVPDN